MPAHHVQRKERSLPALPPALARVSQELQGLAGPALVLDCLQGLAHLRPGRRRPQVPAVDGARTAFIARASGSRSRGLEGALMPAVDGVLACEV